MRSIVAAGVAALVGAGLLVGLGVWQLKRLAWKEALISAVEQRAHASAVNSPPQTDWPALKPSDFEYRHVRLEGEFDYSKQIFVFRALGNPRGRYGGPGYWVFAPLKLTDGACVLVNRGFAPVESKVAVASGPSGRVSVEGLMRSTEDRTWFTPADNPGKGEWYTRDIGEMAAAMGLSCAPFSIDADAGPDAGALPEGGETILSFPNNHLSYAFTWFGMAAALIGVFLAWTFTQVRRPVSPPSI